MPPKTYIEQLLVSVIKRLSLGSVLIILSVLGGGYGFYWGTNGTLKEHTEAIKEIKTDIVEVKDGMNTTRTIEAVSISEQSATKERIIAIEKMIDKIDNKLDRVLIQTK